MAIMYRGAQYGSGLSGSVTLPYFGVAGDLVLLTAATGGGSGFTATVNGVAVTSIETPRVLTLGGHARGGAGTDVLVGFTEYFSFVITPAQEGHDLVIQVTGLGAALPVFAQAAVFGGTTGVVSQEDANGVANNLVSGPVSLESSSDVASIADFTGAYCWTLTSQWAGDPPGNPSFNPAPTVRLYDSLSLATIGYPSWSTGTIGFSITDHLGNTGRIDLGLTFYAPIPNGQSVDLSSTGVLGTTFNSCNWLATSLAMQSAAEAPAILPPVRQRQRDDQLGTGARMVVAQSTSAQFSPTRQRGNMYQRSKQRVTKQRRRAQQCSWQTKDSGLLIPHD